LSVFSLALITIWSYEGGASTEASGPLHTIRSSLSAVITPFDTASSYLGSATQTIGDAVADATASPATLTELQAQNAELAALVMQLEEYRLENERLTVLLQLADAYSLDYTAAHIIKTSIDSWDQTITIDKGSRDGIAVGMPVMSPNGLIGQIESVGPFTAQVRLLTDQNSGVSVFIQSNRTEGVLSGSLEGLLYLNYIPLDVEVKPGDAIITSGAGGVYPKGILIGEVTSVTYSPSDVYQTIVVKPMVRVRYYEEVLILTGRPTEVTYNPSADGQSSQAADGSTGEATGDGANADAANTTNGG
jgi:rod shape-determining protein MreC